MKTKEFFKKLIALFLFLCFSLPAFADTEHESSKSFYTLTIEILENDLQPLLGLTTTVSYFIGLCLIIAGMTRLYRHGSGTQNMMHRASPMATAMYFAAGIVLVSFVPYLKMVSQSVFENAQTTFITQCAGGSGTGQTPNTVLNKDFYTDSNDFCPMMAYSTKVAGAENKGEIGDAMKYLVYGVLFLVGIISFIRGMVHLVKLGEGGGQGGGVGRALTHIFAGIVAINADSFYSLMNNILDAHS